MPSSSLKNQMNLPQKKNLAEREKREGCDSWHRLWFPCSSGAWKKHTTILQVGLPVLPNPVHPRDELLGKLEEVLTLFLFRSYVLLFTFLNVGNSVEGSRGLYKPLSRKWCWDEQVRGRGGEAGRSAGAKGSLDVFSVNLEEGPGAREAEKNEIDSVRRFSSPASGGEERRGGG